MGITRTAFPAGEGPGQRRGRKGPAHTRQPTRTRESGNGGPDLMRRAIASLVVSLPLLLAPALASAAGVPANVSLSLPVAAHDAPPALNRTVLTMAGAIDQA